MKEIRLETLTLRNFKGVRDFTLHADGQDVRIFGDNATGKTTLFDAFLWLLFDKDSQNKKDFGIKTLKDGQSLKGINHEVEGAFKIDGQTLVLQKVYAEKYTKSRSAATKELTGNETQYFIDGVPVKKKEYVEKISSIIDEDVFKLLTSPSYFNEKLHWQDRRKILLEVCGDIPDLEVINSNKKLSPLPGILEGRTIENHRKVIAAKKAEINSELEKLPVRIDEVDRSKPDVEGLNELTLQKNLMKIEQEIADKEDEITRTRSGSEVVEKQKEQREHEIALMNVTNQHNAIEQEHLAAKNDEMYKVKQEINEIETRMQRLQNSTKANNEYIERAEKRMANFREEWETTYEEQFLHAVDNECPTCNQALPYDKVQSAIETARSAFNLRKSNRLEDIVGQGKKLKSDVDSWLEQNAEYQKGISELQQEMSEKTTLLKTIQKNIDDIRFATSKVSETKSYQEFNQKIVDVGLEIKKLQESVESSLEEKRDDLRNLKMQAAAIDSQRARFGQVDAANKRIEELKERERELTTQYNNIEKQLFLTEEFIRTKVEMLTEKINSRFQYARFNLFKVLVNGAVEEVCETLFDGVPYGSGLNNAAQINVGLDIINTLSTHYQFIAPIFVDNAEAVTKMAGTKAQLVSLVVSEPDKKLRVELNDKKGEAA